MPLKIFFKTESGVDEGRINSVSARDSWFNPAAWLADSSTAAVADGMGLDSSESSTLWPAMLVCDKAGMRAARVVGEANSRQKTTIAV